MAVILLILKIIGIILLVLLGLLLLVLALLLFVPVRYRIAGEVGEEISVRIAVTWLLHLVSFRSVYEEGEMNSVLRILGIRGKGKKSSSALEDESWDEPGEEAGEEETEPLRKQPESPKETAVRETSGTQKAAENEERRGKEQKTTESQKPPQESGITNMISRIRGFFENIRAKLETRKRAFDRIKEMLCNIKGFLADENNKIVFPAIWAEVKYLLCHFKFRRIKADLAFSLGDPALTGQALGALSVLPFLYQYEIQIAPDFAAEETYVRGSFEIKGYARGMHLLKSVIRLIRKKEFRIWLKKLLGR